MASYYYLAAQLPYLIYGQGVPMSSASFKFLASGLMNSADARLLDYCSLDPAFYAENAPKTPSAFINNFREWERALRFNLAKGRASKLKREGGPAIDAPDYPADAAAAAKNALSIESPLEAEIFLDRKRWDIIESLQGLNAFSENAIYAYLLKLLLMERRAAFKTEEGFNEYKALYAAIIGLGT